MLNWVDLELLAFIEDYAMGRVQWTLTAYFGNHPDSEVTATMLAEHTGISEPNLRQPLRTLVNQGLIELANADEAPRYRLAANKRLRALARRFARQSVLFNRTFGKAMTAPQPT